MMINIGMVLAPAPGDRHPAAAGVVRRVLAGARAGRDRPADLVRAARARRRARAARPSSPRRGGAPASVPAPPGRRERNNARAPRRRGHGRPHLATARHRRRPAPPRSRDRDHRARHAARDSRTGSSPPPATRSSWCPPVPLSRKLNGDLLRTPMRLRATVKAAIEVIDRVQPDVVVGLRRLRVGAGLPRRSPPAGADRGPRGQRDRRHRQQARRSLHPLRGHQLPWHRAASRHATSGCRSGG